MRNYLRIGFQLCDDCVQFVFNDDLSGVDYYYSGEEAEERCERIRHGAHKEFGGKNFRGLSAGRIGDDEDEDCAEYYDPSLEECECCGIKANTTSWIASFDLQPPRKEIKYQGISYDFEVPKILVFGGPEIPGLVVEEIPHPAGQDSNLGVVRVPQKVLLDDLFPPPLDYTLVFSNNLEFLAKWDLRGVYFLCNPLTGEKFETPTKLSKDFEEDFGTFCLNQIWGDGQQEENQGWLQKAFVLLDLSLTVTRCIGRLM
jgi:hypothetical protein